MPQVSPSTVLFRLTDVGPMTAARFHHELLTRPLPQLPSRDFVLRFEVREFYREQVEKLSDDTTQPYHMVSAR
jgi:hypothetical protein